MTSMVKPEHATDMSAVMRAAGRLVKEYSEKTGSVDVPSIIWALSYLFPALKREAIRPIVLEARCAFNSASAADRRTPRISPAKSVGGIIEDAHSERATNLIL